MFRSVAGPTLFYIFTAVRPLDSSVPYYDNDDDDDDDEEEEEEDGNTFPICGIFLYTSLL